MAHATVLCIDVGTSSVKAGLFDQGQTLLATGRNPHSYTSSKNRVDIDPGVLYESMLAALEPLREQLPTVDAIGFSTLCPNLILMAEDGRALTDGIPHLDRRSEAEGLEIEARVGAQHFLALTGNFPCPGGISATGLLWLKKHQPALFAQTYKIGHTGTYLIQRLTGRFVIDPSHASFTGLYTTTAPDSGWCGELCEALGVHPGLLPEILPSSAVAGRLQDNALIAMGLRKGLPVITGGADTACAVLGAGCTEEGQILNSTGTVEVMALCTRQPHVDEGLLLRASVLPGQWHSLKIVGAGGESLRWFWRNYCREMDAEAFFGAYLPRVLSEEPGGGEHFTPNLAGDRYSVRNEYAAFTGLTLATTRESLLKSLVDGIGDALEDGFARYATFTRPAQEIRVTGGGAGSLLAYKEARFPQHRFTVTEECALRGVARLILEG